MVKVVDSHLYGWGSKPGKSCSFLIVSSSKGLSQYFMCSDQHVKYWMPREFPSTSSLLLDYHVKHYIRTHTQSTGRHMLEVVVIALPRPLLLVMQTLNHLSCNLEK